MPHHTVFVDKTPASRSSPTGDLPDPAEPPSTNATKPRLFVTPTDSTSGQGIIAAHPTPDGSSERFWRALEAAQDRFSLIAALSGDNDAISPQFAKLMFEIWRSSRTPAEKMKEIAEHLTLYRHLRKTQPERTADNTVAQLAAFYRFRREHPDDWQFYEDAVARRQHG